MQVKQALTRGLMLALALSVGALLPSALSAQSALDTTEAEAFVGDWDVTIMSDMGDFGLDLAIADMDGKVGATIDMPDLGASQDVTDITRSGETLVLAYDMNAQGQMVPVTLTLTPSGDNLDAEMDFAQGMFVANGSATPAD